MKVTNEILSTIEASLKNLNEMKNSTKTEKIAFDLQKEIIQETSKITSELYETIIKAIKNGQMTLAHEAHRKIIFELLETAEYNPGLAFWYDLIVAQSKQNKLPNFFGFGYFVTLDQELFFYALKKKFGSQVLHWADDSLRNNKNFMLEATKLDEHAPSYAGNLLKNNKNFAHNIVIMGCDLFGFSESSFINELEFMFEMIKLNPKILKNIGNTLAQQKSFILKVMNYNGMAFQYLPEHVHFPRPVASWLDLLIGGRYGLATGDPYLNDEDVQLMAVEQNGLALQFFKTKNKNIARAAVRQNGLALQYVNDDLLQDKDIVIEAIRENKDAWQFAPKKFQTEWVLWESQKKEQKKMQVQLYEKKIQSVHDTRFFFTGEEKRHSSETMVTPLNKVTFTEEDNHLLARFMNVVQDFSMPSSLQFFPKSKEEKVVALIKKMLEDISKNNHTWQAKNLEMLDILKYKEVKIFLEKEYKLSTENIENFSQLMEKLLDIEPKINVEQKQLEHK